MNPRIVPVINQWRAERTVFSFEKRLCCPVNPWLREPDELYTPLVFIIDVDGFFMDENHTKSIKLHHERVISIDNYNYDDQYIEDFGRDLNLFTAAAYEEFSKILSSFPSPTYTSDPLHMKR